ncbi:MAG: anti-sigma factor [Saprospiraceae bacterium]
MDIKNYISSGVLEDYALGLLPVAEMREVERYANAYPEIKAAITEIENALEQYAQLQGVTPPKHLKEKIEQRISRITTTQKITSSASPTSNSKAINWSLGGLLALAALYAFYLFTQNTELKEQIIAADQKSEQVQLTCDSINAQNNILLQRLDIIRNPDNRSIIMKGTEQHPEAIAAVHWNEEQKQNYLDVINLPAPPSNKQYQLWAIVDGTPVDMGVFDVNIEAGAFVDVPFIEAPQAFAITLEDLGGKPQPNLEQLYVIGNVS